MNVGMDINEELWDLLGDDLAEYVPRRQLDNSSFKLIASGGKPPTPSPFAAPDSLELLPRVPLPQAKGSLHWDDSASLLASTCCAGQHPLTAALAMAAKGPLSNHLQPPLGQAQGLGGVQNWRFWGAIPLELSASFSSCGGREASILEEPQQKLQPLQPLQLPPQPPQSPSQPPQQPPQQQPQQQPQLQQVGANFTLEPGRLLASSHNVSPYLAAQQLHAQVNGTTVALWGAAGIEQAQPGPALTLAPQEAAASPAGAAGGAAGQSGDGASQPMGTPAGQAQQQGSGSGGSPSPTSKGRATGRYKRPEVVQAEKKQKAADQARIRQLEQLVGQLQEQLRGLRLENSALKQKAFVLSRNLKSKSQAEEMIRALQQSTSLGGGSDGPEGVAGALTPAQLQAQLHGAAKGLPPQPVVERLQKMTLPQAVEAYKGMVGVLRALLEQVDNSACPRERGLAEKKLAAVFAHGEATGMFGYLEIVNPRLMAQLMAVNLEEPLEQQGGSASGQALRCDPAHWRGMLEAMRLSDEEMAQLILLLQLYCQRMEQLASRKADVARQLCSELLTELGKQGPDEIGDGQEGADAGPLQDAAAELSALMEAEYWAKFDFMRAGRKLLPPVAQARCIVASYPFHLDLRQFELAIKEKAGQMWRRLVLSTH